MDKKTLAQNTQTAGKKIQDGVRDRQVRYRQPTVERGIGMDNLKAGTLSYSIHQRGALREFAYDFDIAQGSLAGSYILVHFLDRVPTRLSVTGGATAVMLSADRSTLTVSLPAWSEALHVGSFVLS